MSIRISESEMTSDVMVHHAKRTNPEKGLWWVSWLPGRWLTQGQATTAMVLAERVSELVCRDELNSQTDRWLFIDRLADELDLYGPDAVAAVVRAGKALREDRRAAVALEVDLPPVEVVPVTTAVRCGESVLEVKEHGRRGSGAWAAWTPGERIAAWTPGERIAAGGTARFPYDEALSAAREMAVTAERKRLFHDALSAQLDEQIAAEAAGGEVE